VLAIIITIMVLELHVPEGARLEDLADSTTGFLTYLLSFVYIGIYWNNHHHLFQVAQRVDGGVLWANLLLLFCLSLLPLTTAWMDESHLSAVPVVVYGVNLFGAGVAFFAVEHMIARIPGERERLRAVFGRTVKERVSLVLYGVGIVIALVTVPWLGVVAFAVVALLWVVPDRRVERYLAAQSSTMPPPS
jgi:uncharacterized membrane protein